LVGECEFDHKKRPARERRKYLLIHPAKSFSQMWLLGRLKE